MNSIKSELFLLKDEKGPILYAPLKKLSARLNDSAVNSVSSRINGEPLLSEDKPVIELLEEHGFFKDDIIPECAVAPPTEVTLFPSDGCNLRCRYCYASAEKIRHKMPPEVGKAAVDYIVKNAVSAGKDSISVGFHGNGEPFTAFGFMKEICKYAKEKARYIIDQGFPVIENFYSDSLADTPLALCAEKAHLVTNNASTVTDWPKLDAKTMEKVKQKIDTGWNSYVKED